MPKKLEPDTFGKRLQKLREAEKLSLEELAGRANLKPTRLARLEADKLLPPVAEILRLARSLAVEPQAFMGEEKPKDKPRASREALRKRTVDYNYQVLTPESHDKHLMAFLVGIDAGSEHRNVAYRHEGEEFVYVLSGKVVITVGRKKETLGQGQSLHFDSSCKHRLRNPGSRPLRLLVVIYTP